MARSWPQAGHEEETILTLRSTSPGATQAPHLHPGEYEIDLFDDRRPELYEALVTPPPTRGPRSISEVGDGSRGYGVPPPAVPSRPRPGPARSGEGCTSTAGERRHPLPAHGLDDRRTALEDAPREHDLEGLPLHPQRSDDDDRRQSQLVGRGIRQSPCAT